MLIFASMGTTISSEEHPLVECNCLFVLVFKDLPQNRFYCSQKLFMQHAQVCGFGLGTFKIMNRSIYIVMHFSIFQLKEGFKDCCLEDNGRKSRSWQLYECSTAWQVPSQREMYSVPYMANIFQFWVENYCSVQRRNAAVGDETMQDWWVFLQYKTGS